MRRQFAKLRLVRVGEVPEVNESPLRGRIADREVSLARIEQQTPHLPEPQRAHVGQRIGLQEVGVMESDKG